MSSGLPEWWGRNASEVHRVGTLDYASFARLGFYSASRYWGVWVAEYRDSYSFPDSLLADGRRYCSISPLDVLLVLVLSCGWNALRSALTTHLFLPAGAALRLSPTNQQKLPESAWKLAFYSITFSWSAYTILLTPCHYATFADPLSVWDEWRPDMRIGWDIYAIYAVQASFYLHSVHATLFLDVWRKDSGVMLIHHFLTLSLLTFSFSVKHHMVGVLVLLVHDVTDVQLEFTKINTYLKNRNGRTYAVHEMLANIGFAGFAVSWFVFRLYWYPLKVIYAALYGGVELGGAPHIPFVPIFSVLLLTLFAMNLWWFQFILILLYKVGTGQVHEVEDVREDEDGNLSPVAKGAAVQVNGKVSLNGHAKQPEGGKSKTQ